MLRLYLNFKQYCYFMLCLYDVMLKVVKNIVTGQLKAGTNDTNAVMFIFWFVGLFYFIHEVY